MVVVRCVCEQLHAKLLCSLRLVEWLSKGFASSHCISFISFTSPKPCELLVAVLS